MIENRRSRLIGNGIIHTVLIVFSLLCIIPLWAVVSISFTAESSISTEGYALFPKIPSTLAYSYIFKNPDQILRSYLVSIIVTASGTFLALITVSLLAFPLSRTDYRYRRQVTFYVFFTMLFNGGLVPWYILISKYLGLKNSIKFYNLKI